MARCHIALGRRDFLAALASVGWPREARAAERLLAEGTRFETPLHAAGDAQSGPTVLVVGGIHGNERAGAELARRVPTWVPARGRILVVPEANRPALAKKSRYMPGETHADLNRNFPVAGRAQARGVLASAIWTAVLDERPDWVVDLHEGWGYAASSRSMGSSVVRARHRETDAETLRAAELVLAEANGLVDSPNKRFRLLEPGPAGSLARSVVEELAIPALVFETTWIEPLGRRVELHERMLRALLRHLGVLA